MLMISIFISLILSLSVFGIFICLSYFIELDISNYLILDAYESIKSLIFRLFFDYLLC